VRRHQPTDRLTSTASGNLVTLTGVPSVGGGPPIGYIVQAGSTPGSSNLAIVNVGIATSLSASAPTGSYHIRVIAVNIYGSSARSNESTFTIRTTCASPRGPMVLQPTVSGSTVIMNWFPVTGAVSYVVEAGTLSGAANLLTTLTSATNYTGASGPAGTAHIRVRAVNGCGTGPASNQVVVTVSGGGGGTRGTSCGPATASCGQATARCNDGTYSCSQNRSGTGSSHGGVACWICPGALCDVREFTDLGRLLWHR
jgi:predicted phage tail protein